MTPICPACKADKTSLSKDAGRPPYRFYECGECRLVFSNPMQPVNGRWYSRQAMYVVRDNFGTGELQWNHRQFLKDLPAAGGRLLDVGCGTGEFLAAARQAGYLVSGFDFDAEAVKTARQRTGINEITTGDLAQFSGKERTRRFDVVTAFEVLEHSPEPDRFLASLTELIAPNGYLAISVPDRERRPRIRYDWDFPPNHLTRWSRGSLAHIIQRNGLRIVRMESGWRQGEPLLHQTLQFGLVTRLMGAGSPSGGGRGVSRHAASTAYKVKSAAVKILAVPVNLGLSAIGATGMTLYLLAQKNNVN
ncbi:MAG: class I SAM-dependent methyltransferase [Candidatus Omnitrophica bacterium]|nr:class I SAM-dependent methyltransferase [Candidatus Omnitrophota bacterium]